MRCVEQIGLNKLERVVIVDDDDALKEGFTIVLRSLGKYEIVNSYGTCEQALASIKADSPDIVLMDLEMPGIGGLEGIERIKSIRPETEIIVITAFEDLDLLVKALRAGAVGYLVKNKANFFIEAIGALEELKHGGAPMSPTIARKFVTSFQKNRKSPLSQRETDVLELLSVGKSYTIIAGELFISKATVRAHIRNIYEKLQVNRKSEAIALASSLKLI